MQDNKIGNSNKRTVLCPECKKELPLVSKKGEADLLQAFCDCNRRKLRMVVEVHISQLARFKKKQGVSNG